METGNGFDGNSGGAFSNYNGGHSMCDSSDPLSFGFILFAPTAFSRSLYYYIYCVTIVSLNDNASMMNTFFVPRGTFVFVDLAETSPAIFPFMGFVIPTLPPRSVVRLAASAANHSSGATCATSLGVPSTTDRAPK